MSGVVEKDYTKHPQYRDFHDSFAKALQDFQSAKGWTDLVQRLGKLQNVLKKYQSIPILPTPLTFSKRMSQCLMINLPAGVHLKALQTIQMIFRRIGPKLLSETLPIYFTGIFPLFPYATMQVKPILIELIQQFLVPLKDHMIPCMGGLFMSLLPVMEDESSETFPVVIRVLKSIRSNIGDRPFFAALWKSIATSPSSRLAGIKYITENTPKQLPGPKDIDNILPERDTLVKMALINCLADKELLVKRDTLEFLLTRFPIHSNGLNDWTEVAVQVIQLLLLKDVSLSRRSIKWFSDENKQLSPEGKPVLIAALQQLFAVPPDTLQHATDPYKIVTIIIENQDIGEAIIEPVLIYIFHALHRFKEDFAFSRELKTSAHGILDKVNAQTIWEVAGRLYKDQVPDVVAVIDCLIDNMSFQDEASTNFLPVLLTEIIEGLSSIAARADYALLSSSLQLARKVFGKYASVSSAREPENETEGNTQNDEDVSGMATALLSFRKTFIILCQENFLPDIIPNIAGYVSKSNYTKIECERISSLIETIQLLDSLLVHLPSNHKQYQASETDDRELLVVLRKCYQVSDVSLAIVALCTFVEALVHPNSNLNASWRENVLAGKACRNELTQKLWSLLDQQFSQYHHQVISSLISLLHNDSHATNECLLQEILVTEASEREIVCQRFTILWRMSCARSCSSLLTESAFAMWNYLKDPHPAVHTASRSWLVDSMERIDLLLDPLLSVLLHPSITRIDNIYQTEYATKRVIYVFNTLKIMIDSGIQFFANAQRKAVSQTVSQYNEQQEEYVLRSSHPSYLKAVCEPSNYLHILIIASMRFVQGQVEQTDDTQEFYDNNSTVQSISADFLLLLLLKLPKQFLAEAICFPLKNCILFSLYQAVHNSDLVLQVHLIRLLKLCVGVSASYARSAPSDSCIDIEPITDSSLFLSTLTSGLLQPASGDVRFYWLEFILYSLSRTCSDIELTTPPLVNCLSFILVNYKDIYSFQCSKDVMNILHALHSIVDNHIHLPDAPQTPVSTSIIGDIFGVLAGKSDEKPIPTPREDVYLAINEIIYALCSIWDREANGENDLANKFLIQDNIVKIIDSAAKIFPEELLASFFHLYSSTTPAQASARASIFSVLDNSEEMNVSMFFNHCSNLFTSKIILTNPKKQETLLLRYSIEFLVNCVSPQEIRNGCSHFLRFISCALKSRVPSLCLQVLKILQIFTAKGKILTLDDPKYRRELVSYCHRTAELCIHVFNDFMDYHRVKDRDRKQFNRMEELTVRALSELSVIVPELIPVFNEDTEKPITILTNLLVIIKDRRIEVQQWTNAATLIYANIIQANYPNKYWKKDVLQIFNSATFFTMDFEGISYWRQIFRSLFSKESQTTGNDNIFDSFLRQCEKVIQGGASIFSRKEDIVATRSFALKQLAFLLLANEKDKFSSFLEPVKKLLLDSLRYTDQEGLSLVQPVFLVLRVLLIRFSPKRLMSFWANVLCCMIQSLGETSQGNPNEILSVCKFVDVAMISGHDQFKMYEWMFIIDTVQSTHGFVPHISRLVGNHTATRNRLNIKKRERKQPLILDSRVSSVAELNEILSDFATAANLNAIQSGPPNWEVIEQTLEKDLLEFPCVLEPRK